MEDDRDAGEGRSAVDELEAAMAEVVAELPLPALLAARAAAACGPAFAPARVASMLDVGEDRVLEWLQLVADAGVPVTERPDGLLAFPTPVVGWLRASTLPALAQRWAQRMEASDSPPGVSVRRASRAPTHEPHETHVRREEPPRPGRVESARPRPVEPDLDPGVRDTLPRIVAAPPPPPGAPKPRYEDLYRARAKPGAASDLPAPRRSVAPEPPPPPAHEGATNRGAHTDPPARHARAPEVDEEAEAARFLGEARQLAASGRAGGALPLVRAALEIIDRLPPTEERRRLRARVLLEAARLQWLGAGPGAEFTLKQAFETASASRRILHDDDPPGLRARVAATLAGIGHDLGDLPSLERALTELDAAARGLMAAGEAKAAARLLNDQAGIYLRLGDPVRAAYLLEQSRAVFERTESTDPAALRERADTDHLIARLPLHAPARPGREPDALAMAMERCVAAEEAYRALGDTRGLAHVWETMARLDLRAKRFEHAEKRLAAAVQAQEAVGDVLGLARSTAALAEVFAAAGRHGEALRLLADSITFNLEKGSPIGLAFNRRDLSSLAAQSAATAEEQGALAGVAEQLVAAEQIVGRTDVPGRA